jgi:CRISPR-associated protein Cas2
MWVFAAFDLPVGTKAEKRAHACFRRSLLGLGFFRMQYSVYAEFVESEKAESALRDKVRRELPEHGAVRIFSTTDAQFGKMEVYCRQQIVDVETAPSQLGLF